MDKLYIICVDDQREVLSALTEDLEPLEGQILLEECESADEAWDLLDEIDAQGDHAAIIISDHVMPGTSGVEFLSELKKDGRFDKSKKILLTGLATHQDTIKAINQAGLDNYIEKPWNKHELISTIKKLLTIYIISVGLDYSHFSTITDSDTLFTILRSDT
ncbi:MAG TPA: response regulator [Cyclobacteriaceae bacterium]